MGTANLLLSAVLQGYSRKDERQADDLGASYMYRAGYDPLEMPAFFKILNQVEKESPNLIEQLFASHPRDRRSPERSRTTVPGQSGAGPAAKGEGKAIEFNHKQRSRAELETRNKGK